MACFGLRVCRPENPFEVSVPRAEVPRAPPRPTAATSEGNRGGRSVPEGAFRLFAHYADVDSPPEPGTTARPKSCDVGADLYADLADPRLDGADILDRLMADHGSDPASGTGARDAGPQRLAPDGARRSPARRGLPAVGRLIAARGSLSVL